MKTRLHINAARSAATLMLALAIATACGATQSAALAPAAVAGGQINAVTTTATNGIAGGDAYLMADQSYGVAIRAGGATVQTVPTQDAPVCAPAVEKCLVP